MMTMPDRLDLDACQCPLCAAYRLALECVAEGQGRAQVQQEWRAHRREHLMLILSMPEYTAIIDARN